MNVFDSLGPEISGFLSTRGIQTPTPIQERAIPTILAERSNMLLLAPTGSGKTEAALLPLLKLLEEKRLKQDLFGIHILYITPLRALNRDVFGRIEALCDHLGFTVAVRHGDTTQYVRRQQAITPPHLLITTPESLQAILPAQRLRYHLKTVFAVVVDEIHELADSKRGTQLSLGLERLDQVVGSRVQRIGLSATVGNPRTVVALLSGVLGQTRILWEGYGLRKMNLRVEMPQPTTEDIVTSKRISYPVNSTARLRRIVDLVQSHNSTIVFTNTRSFAEALGAKMHALKPPFEFDVHHGSLSKDTRMAAETRLKQGLSRAIIATSSLELGIDIGQADLVVQYSSPREVARALQRTGRAGHGLDRIAEGVFLATVNLDDVTESAVILRRALSNKVEDASIHEKAWDVLCHQIAGIVVDMRQIDRKDLTALIRGAYPFVGVTDEELGSVLNFMAERGIVRVESSKVSASRRTRVFYYEHLSTIPDVRQLNALDMTTRTSIGVLDEDYVTENLQGGSLLVIRGKSWTVVSVDEDEVLCSPASSIDTEAPHWIGEMIPVPYEVASEVAKLWDSIMRRPGADARTWLQTHYGIDETTQDYVIRTLAESHESLGRLPSVDTVLVEDFGAGLVIHTPFGTKANEALGIVVAALLTTSIGVDVGVERDPYRILLTSTARLDSTRVVDTLKGYTGNQVSTILRLAVKHTQTFASRFIHVARRMGVIRRDVRVKDIPVRRLIDAFQDGPVYEETMREVLHDKLDESMVVDLFDRISSGAVEVYTVVTDRPSPLARLIIEEKSRFEVLGEITDENEILRLMEARLLTKQFRLVCMANGDWNSVRTISTLDETVSCPSCGSRMIAAVSPDDSELPGIMKLVKAGGAVPNDKRKLYAAGVLTAELVATYGRIALLALAGRGIGPMTASRILRPGMTDRVSLLRQIAEAERNYARTRPFWE